MFVCETFFVGSIEPRNMSLIYDDLSFCPICPIYPPLGLDDLLHLHFDFHTLNRFTWMVILYIDLTDACRDLSANSCLFKLFCFLIMSMFFMSAFTCVHDDETMQREQLIGDNLINDKRNRYGMILVIWPISYRYHAI